MRIYDDILGGEPQRLVYLCKYKFEKSDPNVDNNKSCFLFCYEVSVLYIDVMLLYRTEHCIDINIWKTLWMSIRRYLLRLDDADRLRRRGECVRQ